MSRKKHHKSKVGKKITISRHVRTVGKLPPRAKTGRFARKIKPGGQTSMF